MRRILVVLLASAALGLAALIPTGAAAKSCPHGFTHAVIRGAQKCLHAGEYCAHSAARQYRRYHYKCVRVRGTYRLEHA